MIFFVSTTAFRTMPLEDVLRLAEQENLALEFSSGLPYRDDLADQFIAAKMPRLPHNYFPAPKTPFVLNLASLNPEVHQKSVRHCLQGLTLAKKAGASFFSVHAGFCVDPRPTDLGQKFAESPSHKRAAYWTNFIQTVRQLGEEASRLGIRIAIENNVVIKGNVTSDGTAPLLCSDLSELQALLEATKDLPVGILLDVGHLKVSASAFGFSADEVIEAIYPSIIAIHHSDNNGRTDSNHPVGQDYWFLKHMPKFKNAHHILEVHDQTPAEIAQQYTILANALETT